MCSTKPAENRRKTDEKFINECQIALKNQQFLSVTCNGVAAVLNRNRLGSGGKGKCIEYNNELLTPNEFQARCGKASSKDWKRSIRFHGRPISRLIEQKILACHAISCICSACSDDANVQTPIRYFKKWNRKRRAQNLTTNLPDFSARNSLHDIVDYKHSAGLSCTFGDQSAYFDYNDLPKINNKQPKKMELVDVYSGSSTVINSKTNNSDSSKNSTYKTEKVVPEVCNNTTTTSTTPNPYPHQLSHLHNEIVNDIVNEQKCWWHLETVAENILRDAITLKTLVSHTKEVSMASKANILVQIRSALSSNAGSITPTIPPQMSLSQSTTSANILNQATAFDGSTRHDMLMRVMAMTKSLSSAMNRQYESNTINGRDNNSSSLFDPRCVPSTLGFPHIRYPINPASLQYAATNSSLPTQLQQHPTALNHQNIPISRLVCSPCSTNQTTSVLQNSVEHVSSQCNTSLSLSKPVQDRSKNGIMSLPYMVSSVVNQNSGNKTVNQVENTYCSMFDDKCSELIAASCACPTTIEEEPVSSTTLPSPQYQHNSVCDLLSVRTNSVSYLPDKIEEYEKKDLRINSDSESNNNNNNEDEDNDNLKKDDNNGNVTIMHKSELAEYLVADDNIHLETNNASISETSSPNNDLFSERNENMQFEEEEEEERTPSG